MNGDFQQLRDASSGLAYEAGLFEAKQAAFGGWTARQRALVCPKAYRRKEGFSEAAKRSEQRGWPVVLRPTGGGIVPQGPGVSNIVLAFNAPRKFTIEDAYRLLVDVIVRGFGALGQNLRPGETPGSFCDGAWNLSLAGRKLVGTAQHWRPVRGQRPRVLAHAMILTDDPGPGAQAIAEMHRDLGLGPIAPEVHTSIRSAFQMADIPRAALLEAAKTALDALPNSNA